MHDDSSQEACYVLPRGYSSESPAHSGLDELELENEEVYTFKTPCNALATVHSNERPPDNYDLPTPPGSFYQIPRTFDKNHNALTPSSSESSCAPPPRPPKPSHGSEGQWGSPQSVGSQNGDVTSAVSVIPRRNTLPAVENIRLHRGTLTADRVLPSFLICYLSMLLFFFFFKHNLTWLTQTYLKCAFYLHPVFKFKSDLISQKFALPFPPPLSSTISHFADLTLAAEQKQRTQSSRHCSVEILMKFKPCSLLQNASFQADKQ